MRGAQLETLKAQMAATVEALKPKAKETKPPKDYVEHFDGHLTSPDETVKYTPWKLGRSPGRRASRCRRF